MAEYRDLIDFLRKHKTYEKTDVTHTRIGDANSILPGKFCIPNDKLPLFYKLYHKHVFIEHKKEYLTEKQLNSNNSSMLVDFDFRYKPDIKDRQHGEEHIEDLVQMYSEKIYKYADLKQDTNFNIYVMEKPNVNTSHKNCDKYTKDGIHMVFQIGIDNKIQQLIRNDLLQNGNIKDVLDDLELTNTYDEVLDEGISKGHTNWQLYGSRKPQNEAYEITHIYNCDIDEDGEICIEKQNVDEYDKLDLLHNSSARYNNKHSYSVRDEYKKDYDSLDKSNNKKINKINNIPTQSNSPSNEYVNKFWDYVSCIPLDHFTSYNNFFEFCCIHKNILGENNYADLDTFLSKTQGYDADKNYVYYFDKIDNTREIKVGWNTLYKLCEKYNLKQKQKLDEKYDNQMSYKRDISILLSGTEYDIAQVFTNLFGHKFIYRKEVLYYYNGVYWEKESKHILRKYISTKFVKIINKYKNFMEDKMEKEKYDLSEKQKEKFENDIVKLMEIAVNCKRTNFKRNVQAEVLDIVTDNTIEFETNTYLFAFNNAIYNLDTDEWVEPEPKQYITLTTGYDYQKVNKDKVDELKRIISSILPKEDIKKFYMCCLSSGLYGELLQKFIICYGCGRNGKGVLNDLFATFMGNYGIQINASVLLKPIDDGVNQQVANMNHKRFSICREPTGAPLNNGTIRQITGSTTTSARGAYDKDTKKFIRHTLFMETNDMLEYKSKIEEADVDRLFSVPFNSKFTDREELIDEKNHIYPINIYYGTDAFREEYKLAMFEIMIEYNKIYKSIKKNITKIEPIEVAELGKEYLINADKVICWCNTRIKKLTQIEYKKLYDNREVCWVSVKDLFTQFKNSETYSLFTKTEKRKFGTKKGFIKYIQKSRYANDFIEKKKFYQRTDEEKTIRNYLDGYKFIECNEDEDDADDVNNEDY